MKNKTILSIILLSIVLNLNSQVKKAKTPNSKIESIKKPIDSQMANIKYIFKLMANLSIINNGSFNDATHSKSILNFIELEENENLIYDKHNNLLTFKDKYNFRTEFYTIEVNNKKATAIYPLNDKYFIYNIEYNNDNSISKIFNKGKTYRFTYLDKKIDSVVCTTSGDWCCNNIFIFKNEKLISRFEPSNNINNDIFYSYIYDKNKIEFKDSTRRNGENYISRLSYFFSNNKIDKIESYYQNGETIYKDTTIYGFDNSILITIEKHGERSKNYIEVYNYKGQLVYDNFNKPIKLIKQLLDKCNNQYTEIEEFVYDSFSVIETKYSDNYKELGFTCGKCGNK